MCRLCVIMGLCVEFTQTHFYCPYEQRFDERVSLEQLRYKNCHLRESEEGEEGAGPATNVRITCKQERTRKNEYYTEIAWDRPVNSGTPVDGYRVYIQFYLKDQVCFQLPPDQLRFEFNRSVGLIHDCMMVVGVTPQPISRRTPTQTHITRTTMSQQCPLSPKLSALRNVVVRPGQRHSFRARFRQQPVPVATVTWYFSTDKTNCQNSVKIETSHREGRWLSEDNLILTLNATRAEHVGCYIVTASNGVGHGDTQRGYLDLNRTLVLLHQDNVRLLDVEECIFISLAGFVLLLLLTSLSVWMCRQRGGQQQQHLHRLSAVSRTKCPTVYVSHCTAGKGDEDRLQLVRLAGALQSFGMDVVVDICSQV